MKRYIRTVLGIAAILAVLSVPTFSYGDDAPMALGTITDEENGNAIGEMYMLGGGSVQFDSSGNSIIGGSGKQEYRATVADGLYLNLAFSISGHCADGGH